METSSNIITGKDKPLDSKEMAQLIELQTGARRVRDLVMDCMNHVPATDQSNYQELGRRLETGFDDIEGQKMFNDRQKGFKGTLIEGVFTPDLLKSKVAFAAVADAAKVPGYQHLIGSALERSAVMNPDQRRAIIANLIQIDPDTAVKMIVEGGEEGAQ